MIYTYVVYRFRSFCNLALSLISILSLSGTGIHPSLHGFMDLSLMIGAGVTLKK